LLEGRQRGGIELVVGLGEGYGSWTLDLAARTPAGRTGTWSCVASWDFAWLPKGACFEEIERGARDTRRDLGRSPTGKCTTKPATAVEVFSGDPRARRDLIRTTGATASKLPAFYDARGDLSICFPIARRFARCVRFARSDQARTFGVFALLPDARPFPSWT